MVHCHDNDGGLCFIRNLDPINDLIRPFDQTPMVEAIERAAFWHKRETVTSSANCEH